MQIWRSRRRIYHWILAALSESASAIPWLLLLQYIGEIPFVERVGTQPLPFLFAAGALWESWSRTRSGDGRVRRVFGLLVGMTMTYLLTAAWAFLPLALYLWYQGVLRAVEGVEYGRMMARFTLQTVLYIVGCFLLAVMGIIAPKEQVMLEWSALLFLTTGLILLAVTRESSLRKEQATIGESGAGGELLGRYMDGLVLLLLGVSFLVSRLFSTERVASMTELLFRIFQAPFSWLFDIAMLIIIRWLMLIMFVITYLRSLVSVAKKPDAVQRPMEVGDLAELAEETQRSALMDWLPYLKMALLVLMLLVGAIILYRLVNPKQAPTEEELEEERVNLGVWANLLADLKGLITGRNRSAPVGGTAHSTDVIGTDPRSPRHLFRMLQAWGESLGRRRHLSETPKRYASALMTLQPAHQEAIEAITNVYQQARYGERPPTEEAISIASDAVQHLHKRNP